MNDGAVNNLEGAIYDLEGTLVKLPIDYEALYEEIKRLVKVSKVKPLIKTVKSLNDVLREKTFELWEQAELNAVPKMSTNEEGMKMYRRHSNKPSALVTMQGKTVVRKILDRFSLFFNVIITREDEIDRMRQIKAALNSLSLEAKNVVVFGDRDSDEAAARLVGCKFVRVKA